MYTSINEFKEYLKESINISTSNYDMYDILKSLPYIKYIDRPTGQYLQSIDLKINDIEHLNDLNSILEQNNWYIERGHDTSYTVSQQYIKEAESKIPSILYHITPSKNIESIYKDGLKPKSEDLRHKFPPRIYVSDNIPSLKSLENELKRWKNLDDKYVIVRINTKGLNFTLYKDPTSAYKGHYYIQNIDKIPSENISVLK